MYLPLNSKKSNAKQNSFSSSTFRIKQIKQADEHMRQQCGFQNFELSRNSEYPERIEREVPVCGVRFGDVRSGSIPPTTKNTVRCWIISVEF